MKCKASAGKLKHRVELKQPVLENGDLGVKKTHKTFATNRPANCKSVGGIEVPRGNQVVAIQNWKVTMRFDSKVTREFQVIYGDHTLEVFSIVIDDRRRFMTLSCKEAVI